MYDKNDQMMNDSRVTTFFRPIMVILDHIYDAFELFYLRNQSSKHSCDYEGGH